MNKNSLMVIGAVIGLGLIKKTIGSSNSKMLSNVPRGEYFSTYKIAQFQGISEFQVIKILREMKKQGKVWESDGLYMIK